MRISDWSSDVCSSDLILTVMLYGRGVHFALTCMAFLLVTAVLAIFFAGAFPANQETQNWTVIPSDWEELRRQWEYSHAINALLILIAFSALARSESTRLNSSH